MNTFAQPFRDYELLDRVGAGAMGTVFKAMHKRLNRIVALKVLKPSLARDARYVDRLRREARIVASLSHPHIVTGYDLGEEGGYHYFVMEFVEGKSLRALLAEWGMFAEEYVLRVARQVALALDHAYQRGVIHRDIKPGNILIDDAGAVKLTDLGLAKGPADLTLTRDGATVGTPQYISPEQARNPQDVDVRSDLYSLGATLYHMATGSPPHRGDTMAELITQVLHGELVPPDQLNPALSPGLVLVIRKLLARNLSLRYQTPRELLDDLDRIDRSLPPSVDPRGLETATPSRPRWPLGVLPTALVVLLIGVAWWAGANMGEPAAPQPAGEQFLPALDRELAALSPGARLLRLQAVGSVPDGLLAAVAQRRSAALVDLQAAVDNAVAERLGPGWADLRAWLRAPANWPDRQAARREQIDPGLAAAAGVALGLVPGAVRLDRVDELRLAVDREIAARDADLLAEFEAFLAGPLAARVDDRLRAGDFVAAERLWREAPSIFCDGVQRPLPDRLDDELRRALRERHRAGERAVATAIEAAEAAVATALRSEVAAMVAMLQARLQEGADPEVVGDALHRLRRDLEQSWPAASRFSLERNPWPDVEQQLAVLGQTLALAGAEAARARLERRCDAAWHALRLGRAADGLALLADASGDDGHTDQRLEQHRRALAAAARAEREVLQAVARAERPLVAFLGSGGLEPIELRVEARAAGLCLIGQALGQPPRQVHLTEVRIGDLCERLGLAAAGGIGGQDDSRFGLVLLRLCAGDLADLASALAALPAADRQFVADDIWPRLARMRGEPLESLPGRQALFDRLRVAVADLERSGSAGHLSELEKALLVCESRLPVEQRRPDETRELRKARQLLELVRRSRPVAADLAAAAPRGSSVDVRVAEQQVVAEVAVPASSLLAEAGEGWQLRNDRIEFSGGSRPWRDRGLVLLRCRSGLDATAGSTRLECELVVPPAESGRRCYLFEFRGLAVCLALAGDDSVYAALVEGDASREAAAQQAFERALAGALGEGRVLAIPGAVHRLTIAITASPTRARARVAVAFDGAELLAEVRPLDPDQPPAVAVHALQDLAIRRIVVIAQGL